MALWGPKGDSLAIVHPPLIKIDGVAVWATQGHAIIIILPFAAEANRVAVHRGFPEGQAIGIGLPAALQGHGVGFDLCSNTVPADKLFLGRSPCGKMSAMKVPSFKVKSSGGKKPERLSGCGWC